MPAVLVVIQSTLMLTIFKYDTPVSLKQRQNYDSCMAVLKKIYAQDQVQIRYDEIIV